MEITLDTRVVRSNEPVSAAVGESLVMFSVEKGRYYGLNELASDVWKRIETPITVSTLCADLQKVFDVTPERCETDVLDFLRKLDAKGLLKVAS
jgi:hypothetical protein